MRNQLFEQIAEMLLVAFRSAFSEDPEISTYGTIAITQPEFGDLSSNIAMRVAAKYQLAPMEVAQKLIDHCSENGVGSVIERMQAQSPGFINFTLSSAALLSPTVTIAGDWMHVEEQLSSSRVQKTVVMDYSHPNIGKPMGVHHLLSTIIGDSIKRILRGVGYEVIADNFIGDLGTQFGRLIWAVKQWGNAADIERDPITELQKLYVKFHIEAESDVVLDDAGREEYRKLEEGDEENRALWQKIVTWSKAEIQPIYDALGVEFDHMNGESFYEDKMAPIIKQGEDEGVFVASQGALVCFSDDPDAPPAVIRKGDGATLYITRDLARIKYWEDTWHPDVMLVVVDAAQQFAQNQLYSVAHKLHLTNATLVQANFGRMRFSDGAMSTRKGNILLLKDLLIESEKRALELVREKSATLSDPEQLELAKILSVGALKYNILAQNRHTDITFNWDTMLSLEGNSAPYLMYTVVRAASLLTKAKFDIKAPVIDTHSHFMHPIERELALLISDFHGQIAFAAQEYRPNIIANYLYSLAQRYNTLYGSLPVLEAPESERLVRLQLVSATKQIIAYGLGLLGINIPNKM